MKNFENGVHDISNEDYHASSAISRSSLFNFSKSPYHYWYYKINSEKEAFKETSQMLIGSMLHTFALEPDQFKERYIVAIRVDKRTKQGKADWNKFLEEAGDRTLVTHEQYAEVTRIYSRLKQDKIVPKLVESGNVEKSIFFTHEQTGIQCKVRPDMWFKDLVCDLKTTSNASYRAMQRSCVDYGYFLQAGMISEALRSLDIELESFYIAAVETKAPFATRTARLDDDCIRFGIKQFNTYMQRLKECKDENKWPGYEIENMLLPNYMDDEL